MTTQQLNNTRLKLRQLKEQLKIEKILINEACVICGKPNELKCLACLLNNQVAGYCLECRGNHSERFHTALWISGYE